MRIAIVGSMQWEDSAVVRSRIDRLIARRGYFDVRVLGDGAVADIAGAHCKLKGLHVEFHGRGRRGRPTVPESPLEDVDLVVAFWNGVSDETGRILRLAEDMGMTAWVIRPDGGRYRHC